MVVNSRTSKGLWYLYLLILFFPFLHSCKICGGSHIDPDMSLIGRFISTKIGVIDGHKFTSTSKQSRSDTGLHLPVCSYVLQVANNATS